MRRFWFALWLIVLGWDGLLPHIERESPRLALVALLAAAALLAGRRIMKPWTRTTLSLGLATGFALAAFLLPWPESLGPWLLAAGFAASAVPPLVAWTRGQVWAVPGAMGGLLTLLAAGSHAYRYVESSYRDLTLAAPPIAFFYRLLGVSAAADPPFVHWQGVGNLHTFDCTVEKLVGHGLALFVGAALAALLMIHGKRIGWKRPLGLLLITGLFAVARTLVLGLALDESASPSAIFYDRVWVFGALLPLVALLAWRFPPLGSDGPREAVRSISFSTFTTRRAAAALAVALLAGALAAGSLGFFDPGSPKAGRVLIDENHSNWEWSTVDLNTESYGVQTVYNYSELVRYLGHYFDIRANFDPLTDSLLATTDVMILKTPTRPYQEDEVDALVRFVERGGGLWLVGDHTNVFGMSTNLNKVARRFGLRYRFDAVIDLKTNGRQLFRRPRSFAHPSIRHLPPILMATSSSMEAPALAQRVMVGRSLLSDWLDYSVNAFFGDFRADPSEAFGAVLQSAAVTRGRGRVLGFSDSTIFSNFFMFIRGKPELALGSVHWLMHRNRCAWAERAFFWSAVAGALLLVGLAASLPRPVVLVSLGAALLGFAVLAGALDGYVGAWSELPEPRTPLPSVAFDRGRTDYEVPDVQEFPEDFAGGFHTFYVWTQRVGYMPSTRLFENCLEKSDILVLINPRAHFHGFEIAKLQAYVSEGGGLLVMDTPHAQHSSANAVLGPFGMSFTYTEMESVAVLDAARGDSLAVMNHVGRVEGGEPVLLLPDGSSALSRSEVGRGRVVALCASDSFSDKVLGTTSQIPDENQLALYRIQFRIFDELLRPLGAAAVNSGD